MNYELDVLRLDTLDLTRDFHEVVFYEDITSNEMSGSITFSDTETVREKFTGLENGLTGEEILTIVFRSIEPVSKLKHKTISLQFDVYKTENSNNKDHAITVNKLHFVSRSHKNNTAVRNRCVWKDKKSSDIVSIITSEQLKSTLASVDEDSYTRTFHFPNWTPFEVCNYLAQVSKSARYNDPSYLFYEDRNGFHFVTLSYLMDKGKSHTMNERIFTEGIKGNDPLAIVEYSTSFLYDNLMNDHLGMYGNSMVWYDKIDKKFGEESRTYTGTWGQFTHVGETKLTRRLQENEKSVYQTISKTREGSPGVYVKPEEWACELLTRSPQLHNNRWTVLYNGCTDINLGDVIEFDLKSTKYMGQSELKLSGNYLVYRIKHVLNRTKYDMICGIAKDGYKQ